MREGGPQKAGSVPSSFNSPFLCLSRVLSPCWEHTVLGLGRAAAQSLCSNKVHPCNAGLSDKNNMK
jgi:hypothetical protein